MGPVGVRRGEIARRRGHMPIRQLVQRAGPAIQALKPVMMMSPLSVAQFLTPGRITFDLLVMDEAIPFTIRSPADLYVGEMNKHDTILRKVLAANFAINAAPGCIEAHLFMGVHLLDRNEAMLHLRRAVETGDKLWGPVAKREGEDMDGGASRIPAPTCERSMPSGWHTARPGTRTRHASASTACLR